MKLAEKAVKEHAAKGYVETERSLSRRFLLHGTPDAGKFWCIQLTGEACAVCFGKHGTHPVYASRGQQQVKYFESAAAAREFYHKEIAKKLKGGYVELHPRETEFTQEPAAAAKPVKKATKKSASVAKEPKVAVAKVAKPPVVKAAEAPQLKINTAVTRQIDLAPHVWFYATWRNLPPLPKPEPAPFDKPALVAQIRGLKSEKAFRSFHMPGGFQTPAEAHFWFDFNKIRFQHSSPQSLATALEALSHDGQITVQDCTKQMAAQNLVALVPLAIILSADEFIDYALAHDLGEHAAHIFHFYYVPYLSLKERERLRDRIGKLALQTPPPTAPYWHPHTVYHFAAVLGCHDIIEQAVKWPNDAGYLLYYGLPSADRVYVEVAKCVRAGRYFTAPMQMTWLAHTEYRGIDLLVEIVRKSSKHWINQTADLLALIKAPDVAPIMLELQAKGIEAATTWLNEQVGNAVTGLLPVAAGQGKLATAAQNYLTNKRHEGFGHVIDAALANADPEVVAKQLQVQSQAVEVEVHDAKSTPKDLAKAVKEAQSLQAYTAKWLTPESLPPIIVGKRGLNAEQREAVLSALAASELGEPHDLLKVLKQHAEQTSLEAFAWELFERWQAAGAPAKERWAMKALGHLGHNATALKLTPLVRKWPGESQHPRAVLGLECLRAIGTDTALMQLSGIAQKVKFQGLQRKATECVDAIAKDLGLTRAQLEDRVVPDCGLDERGRRVFDFGPRQFHFALGADLKPMLRDSEGKLRDNLPKPSSKDDATLAAASERDWKELKKQIREVAKIQAVRLEQAMVTCRRWPSAYFLKLLAQHPLMTHLVRELLWAGYDKKGKRTLLFRVTDEQELTDADEKSVSLEKVAEVGVVHRLHLTEQEANRFGEVFSDYEIIPPFPQLGRAIHTLSKADAKANAFTELTGLKFAGTALVGTLERLGWTRGPALDNGIYCEHYKHFPTADVTASVSYRDGMPMGYVEGWEDQTLETCCLEVGLNTPREWASYRKRKLAKLAAIDPVVISEVLGDLHTLAGKAK